MPLTLSIVVVTLAALVGIVVGETHTIHFENKYVTSPDSLPILHSIYALISCGFGTVGF